MKHTLWFVLAASLLLAACKYDAPLAREHALPIRTDYLGLWEPVPENGNKPEPGDRLLVLKASDTEYLVHYPVGLGKDGLYYRAYPLRIGGVDCIQLQVIGTEKGPAAPREKELFQVVACRLSFGKLTVRILNSVKVDPALKTTEALARAFIAHKKDKDLFENPGTFRRVKN